MLSRIDSCIIVLLLKKISSNTLTNNRLDWQALLPDSATLATLCASAAQLPPISLAEIQPRLERAITLFCQSSVNSRFMLIKAEETHDYMALIAQIVTRKLPVITKARGVRYHICDDKIEQFPATSMGDNFAAQAVCLHEEWLEHERLFGCLRQHNQTYQLSPGLVHRANGGVLVLSVRTLLSQPKLWLRLKQMVVSQYFQWLPVDESRPLPLAIPDMPLDLRIILIGNYHGLGELEEFDPELIERATYTEFEAELAIQQHDNIVRWCRYVHYLANELHLSKLASDIWLPLIRQGIRHTGDQAHLPLCPMWIGDRLHEAALYSKDQLTAAALEQARTEKCWYEGYLQEKSQEEIYSGQVHIATEGATIGQINALSVLQYPGHPQMFGEPSRITCVAHIGDGEINDVERKAELGGNLHAKGMMIMEAFLISELDLEQQFPFSASVVFEQSYGEVDGDSASLAELCALISALSLQPINQAIAVTGSVDQFGNIQPIGGINEKIEGFFTICQNRGLSGQQGVILPERNIRHLCLDDQVIAAVQEGTFHLWSVNSVADALLILTGLPFRDEENLSLLAIIQERILQASLSDKQRLPWFLRWINWFNQR